MKALKRLFKIGTTLGLVAVFCMFLSAFGYDYYYQNKIYPWVKIAGLVIGNKEPDKISDLLPKLYPPKHIEFYYQDRIFTPDLSSLEINYDYPLMAKRAFSIGRQSNDFYYNYSQKIAALLGTINLPLEITFSRAPLETWLAQTNSIIGIDPQDAIFNFKPQIGPDQKGRVLAFQNSRDGQRVDQDAILNLIKEFSLKGLCPRDSSCRYPLPIKIIRPRLTDDRATQLGLQDAIGIGESFFYDSIPTRIENIRIGTEKISGSLVAPGEVFSFNDAIGTVSAIFGFKKAYVIKEGKTVLDDGGGVCQVSTTLYRAVLNAGLPVVERSPHSYRVGFYEQGGFLPGMDATVYPPGTDFRFHNDTPGWILLLAQFNPKKQHLQFAIIGTSDHRKSEVTGPFFLSRSPPPEPVYEDDPNIAMGQVKQVDTAHPGAKVYFARTVTRNDEILIKESVYSDYVPWPARFLRGIKPN